MQRSNTQKVVCIGRSLRMKLTGTSMVIVNSKANMGLILVVAFLFMRQFQGKELSSKK